jgi:hypothetical protein
MAYVGPCMNSSTGNIHHGVGIREMRPNRREYAKKHNERECPYPIFFRILPEERKHYEFPMECTIIPFY